MDYPTSISLPVSLSSDLPEEYDFQDVRYTPELVRYFLNRYTHEGDTILDPFAGFGTTMIEARNMNRKPFGIEIDPDKINYLRTYHNFGSELVHGDTSRLFLEQHFPNLDFVMTSPPYMGREDSADALTGYRYGGTYSVYLDQLQAIFSKIKSLLNPDAIVVVEVSNLKQEHSITTLAWDMGTKLSQILTFAGEIIVNWEGDRSSDRDGIYNYGYDHSYCLVYRN